MSDTPMQPASGSVTTTGIAAALAMSLIIAPTVGVLSAAASALTLTSATATVITPTAGGATLAGVASAIAKPTVTAMVPTAGALSLSGVASTVAQINQAPTNVPGILTLLYNASATGLRMNWPGGKGLFAVAGTFSGATVTLNILGPDGQTMLAAATATTLTAVGVGIVELPPCVVQAGVTSGTPSGLYATFSRVPTEVG